jgi:quercetin dioxygenase-like cupin family protein
MRHFLPQFFAIVALAAAFTLPAHGQVAPPAAPEGAAVVHASEVEWAEIVPGIRFAAVYGQWDREAHGKLVSADPGVRTPMHVHSGGYHGMVIEGTVTNPYAGEVGEVRMGPGTYWYVPAGAPHATACVSEEPCLFYTYADGAWDIEVVEGT